WLERAREAYLKFVISRPEEVDEIPPLLERCGIGGFPPPRIFLMPEALTAREVAQKSAWLVPLCLERGFRFSTRLHILLWGARRGV
ncbi:MAG: radical SAM protein, partial [Nitrospinota bacterium]